MIEVDIADDDADLLVVTENGYGKRTRVGDYPVKGRGTMGVKTAQLVERKGRLAGARIVRDGYQVMLISDGGTVIRIPVDGIRRAGRSTQGVIVMRLREGEQVATLAPVIGSDDDVEIPEPPPSTTAQADAEPRSRRRRAVRLSYALYASASFDSAVSRSIGIGNTIVELFDAPISSRVCR